jgi:hypothetical protein
LVTAKRLLRLLGRLAGAFTDLHGGELAGGGCTSIAAVRLGSKRTPLRDQDRSSAPGAGAGGASATVDRGATAVPVGGAPGGRDVDGAPEGRDEPCVEPTAPPPAADGGDAAAVGDIDSGGRPVEAAAIAAQAAAIAVGGIGPAGRRELGRRDAGGEPRGGAAPASGPNASPED